MMQRALVSVVLLCALALAASGCAAFLPRTVPSQFFVLDADTEPAAATPLPIALGVGPIQIPGYLDRPQIATRTGANEIGYSETHRWATPLQQGVTNVLLADLGARLHTDRLSAFPFALAAPRDFDVTVDFLHFEGTASGTLELEAVWRVLDGRSGAELVVKRASLSRSVAVGDFAAGVAALSEGLRELSDQIAAALREAYARR
jgi:uncharacterized lipoprotein YmbA